VIYDLDGSAEDILYSIDHSTSSRKTSLACHWGFIKSYLLIRKWIHALTA